MSKPRLIKRYANRKLYDTKASSYITLDDIAEILEAGEDVQIIDNKTKEDLTRVTLAQILVERSRDGKLGDSMSSLRGLIRNTGEHLTRKISDPVTSIRSSVGESVNRLIRTGEERAAETRGQIQSWIAQNTLAIEELQAFIDERVKTITHWFDTLTEVCRELERLTQRIENLEARLAKYETQPEPTAESRSHET